MAGAFLGFHSFEGLALIGGSKPSIPILANLMLAFVGGVAGHLLFNLVYVV